MTRCRRFALLLLLSAIGVNAYADDVEELRRLRDTTISLVNLLVQQGVLTREKADALIAQAEQAGSASAHPSANNAANGSNANTSATGSAAPGTAAQAAPAPTPAPGPTPPPGTVRVPYVPESVKQQITEEVKRDVLAQAKTERWGVPDAYPEWIRHIIWSGDMRFRTELDRYPTANGLPNAPIQELQAFGVNLQNSSEPNTRLRIRARFGMEAFLGDTVTSGIRLASGGVGIGTSPASESQTLGNYAARSSVGFDRAFIAYHPGSWFTIMGGRVGNPFFRASTLVWSDDLSLEGVFSQISLHPGAHWGLQTVVGAFPILQNDPTPLSSAPSKWLYGYQEQFSLHPTPNVGWTLAAAYYDYRNIEAIPNPSPYTTEFSATAAPYRQTGNTVFDVNGQLNTLNGTQNYLWGLASKFHELNIASSFDVAFTGRMHLRWDADWVLNLGYNREEILRRTGYLVDKQNYGWQTRLTFGDPLLVKHAWQVWIAYRYAQRDATVDAFTDGDFHFYGTDNRGYMFGATYGLERNTGLLLRWMSARQITGVELAGATGTLPLAIDILQLDAVAAF
jgi:hypothetical protein